MASSLLGLPAELFIDILTYALYNHPTPSDVLCLAQSFYTVGLRILHADLRLRTVRQLAQFSAPQESPEVRLACAPKTLSLSLPGGTATSDVFLLLAKALRRCSAALNELSADEGHRHGDTRVPLDVLRLCLHSHMRIDVQHIYDALILVESVCVKLAVDCSCELTTTPAHGPSSGRDQIRRITSPSR